MLPKIIEECTNVIKGIVDNTDDLAVVNCLNAKFAYMISMKGVTFRQFTNAPQRTLSYYGMSFQSSGSSKDFVIDTINDVLMPFIKEELENKIDEYKTWFEYENKGSMKAKKIEEELNKIRVVNPELQSPNVTGLYREAEQIKKIKFGSLFVRISELGDYISSITGGDKAKKELFENLKTIFEGTISPSIIAGDSKRQTLKLVPVQAMLYTDFENLYNEKVKDYYIASLKTGMARRSFIFFADEDKKINYPRRFDEKENAYIKAHELKKVIKSIYDNIPTNMIYTLSEESKNLLFDWQCRCTDFFNSSTDNIIIKLERKNSFWKITKLAVIYSIIDNPTETVVKSDYVKMAIDFYNQIIPSLKKVIEKHKDSEIDMYVKYFLDNSDKVITKTELRNLNFVSKNRFKKYFEEHFDEIKEDLLNYGYGIYDCTKNKNIKGYQLVRGI